MIENSEQKKSGFLFQKTRLNHAKLAHYLKAFLSHFLRAKRIAGATVYSGQSEPVIPAQSEPPIRV